MYDTCTDCEFHTACYSEAMNYFAISQSVEPLGSDDEILRHEYEHMEQLLAALDANPHISISANCTDLLLSMIHNKVAHAEKEIYEGSSDVQ